MIDGRYAPAYPLRHLRFAVVRHYYARQQLMGRWRREMRRQYGWESRVIGAPWRIVLPAAGQCAGVSRSARVAFNRWRAADESRAGLGLMITHHWYTGPESTGRKVDSLHLELFRLAPHQIHRRPLATPPADAMASVRARRAERAGSLDVDRRRRYDWQATHGHTVMGPDTPAALQYRAVEKMRASWYGWKRQRQDSGFWDLAEAAAWRLRIDTTDPRRVVGIVTDTRLPAPAGTPPLAPELAADRVLAAVADLPPDWPHRPASSRPLDPETPADW